MHGAPAHQRSEAHPRSRGENILRSRKPEAKAGSSPLTRGKLIQVRVGHLAVRLIPAHAGKTTQRAAASSSSTAHPRSRGENACWVRGGGAWGGSSPLTRGKQRPGKRPSVTWRLIPAHAGKTAGECPHEACQRAHPRSRGENIPPSKLMSWRTGSSPLTRGKPCSPPPLSRSTRLIPAHAGKTDSQDPSTRAAWAHPRSRGENEVIKVHRSSFHGSSPLTRGKPGAFFNSEALRRLIPAHAGKTLSACCLTPMTRAHPRSRGENLHHAKEASVKTGSSPLTRGKRSVIVPVNITARLIPAHAGKTRERFEPGSVDAAHPRSRGENSSPSRRTKVISGSSPLTRGKRPDADGGGGAERLIPAHAGKTKRLTLTIIRLRAHPRSRGENGPPRPEADHHSGSSPLTRGKRPEGKQAEKQGRLIPAHAGKTRMPRPRQS